MKINREIRAPRVRLIDENGKQLGIMGLHEALSLARDADLDLVEMVATSSPPVCKIMNYGKFRYDQTKRERENRKSQRQIKIKEVKFGPNISEHDLDFKVRQARSFLEKGNKVKITCMFRGREMAHRDVGERLMKRVIEILEPISMVESSPSLFGRFLGMVLAPLGKKK